MRYKNHRGGVRLELSAPVELSATVAVGFRPRQVGFRPRVGYAKGVFDVTLILGLVGVRVFA